jgi:D-amino peptidase
LIRPKTFLIALLLPILTLLPPQVTSRAQGLIAKPKILLLYDMEGVSGINRLAQVLYPGAEYDTARHLLTADVNAAIRGLKAGGAGEIVVVDGHGSGNWREPDIILAEMDKRAAMRFTDTPFDPYTSPDESFDAIVSIGAHASTGKPGFLAHTRARISSYKVNGVELTETSIIALSGMRFGIPVIMVSGDEVLQSQIKEQFPGAEYGLVKTAKGVRDAELFPIELAHHNIERAAEAAIMKLSRLKPLSILKPFNFEFSYRNKAQADYASRYPGVKRIDSLTVGYGTDDIIEGINVGKRLTRLAEQEFRDVLLEIINKRPDGPQIVSEWQRQLDERWLNSIQETRSVAAGSPTLTKPAQKQQFWGDF